MLTEIAVLLGAEDRVLVSNIVRNASTLSEYYSCF